MLRNLSITEKLLGRPDPSRTVKRRVHGAFAPPAIPLEKSAGRPTPQESPRSRVHVGFSMPETRHTVDVQRIGNPPKVIPPFRGQMTVSIHESAWIGIGVPAFPEGT